MMGVKEAAVAGCLAGTRLRESDIVGSNLELQGNAEHLELDVLLKRYSLRDSPGLISAIKQLWEYVVRAPAGKLDKLMYVEMMVLLFCVVKTIDGDPMSGT
jgi:hypothetical protein